MGSSQLWGGGGQVRLLAAYIGLGFGFFFLLVYFKTRELLYLMASLVGYRSFHFLDFRGRALLIAGDPMFLTFCIIQGFSYLTLSTCSFNVLPDASEIKQVSRRELPCQCGPFPICRFCVQGCHINTNSVVFVYLALLCRYFLCLQ